MWSVNTSIVRIVIFFTVLNLELMNATSVLGSKVDIFIILRYVVFVLCCDPPSPGEPELRIARASIVRRVPSPYLIALTPRG